jgi:hypothetical protein
LTWLFKFDAEASGTHFLQDVAIDRSWLWVVVCFASQAKAEFENHVWANGQYANQK